MSSVKKKNKCNVYITKAQLRSIIDLKGDIEGMIGCADDDSHWLRHIRNIENFLKNNKIKQ